MRLLRMIVASAGMLALMSSWLAPVAFAGGARAEVSGRAAAVFVAPDLASIAPERGGPHERCPGCPGEARAPCSGGAVCTVATSAGAAPIGPSAPGPVATLLWAIETIPGGGPLSAPEPPPPKV